MTSKGLPSGRISTGSSRTRRNLLCKQSSKDPAMIWDSLMDTGATRSCMNYNMFMKIGNGNLRQKGTPTVTVADGGNLGAIGITTCKIWLGTEMIKQDFIVCTYLK